MNKSIYIHILEGRPAFFNGQQLCFVTEGGGGKGAPVAYSLRQIRDEHRKSADYRRRKGYDTDLEVGYRRYRITDEKGQT